MTICNNQHNSLWVGTRNALCSCPCRPVRPGSWQLLVFFLKAANSCSQNYSAQLYWGGNEYTEESWTAILYNNEMPAYYCTDTVAKLCRHQQASVSARHQASWDGWQKTETYVTAWRGMVWPLRMIVHPFWSCADCQQCVWICKPSHTGWTQVVSWQHNVIMHGNIL